MEIVQAIIQGDEKALEYLLVTVCWARLAALCYANPRARLEPEDLAQELTIMLVTESWKMLRYFRGFNPKTQVKSSLKNYILTCAWKCIVRMTKQATKKADTEVAWYEDLGLTDGKDAWRAAQAEEERISQISRVWEALMTMTNTDRLVLVEFVMNKKPAKEVACVLGLEPDKKGIARVHSLVWRAKQNLRTILERGDKYA